MKIERPSYRIHHLSILVAMAAGFFAALPAALAAFFTLMTLIAVVVFPTFRPESCVEGVALVLGLAIVEAAVMLASLALQSWLDRS